MNVVDANVLLYAVNVDADRHHESRRWLDESLSGAATVGFSWLAMLAFVRLSTKIGLFPRPLSIDGALGHLDAWTAQPTAEIVQPTTRHLTIVRSLLQPLRVGGNLVNDAHLAALAIEHRGIVISYDNDFDRFPGVHRKTPEPSTAAPESTLETERLSLTPLTVEDADEMVDVLADPDLYRFIGGSPPTLDQLRDRYQQLVRGGSPDGRERWHNWIVRRTADGRAVGYVQATVVPNEHRADIAWVIAPMFQRQGYATEASRAMVDWLRRRDVSTLAAHIHPDHDASNLVAQRIGLSATETVEDGERRWIASL